MHPSPGRLYFGKTPVLSYMNEGREAADRTGVPQQPFTPASLKAAGSSRLACLSSTRKSLAILLGMLF
jgi:hypothetical protein